MLLGILTGLRAEAGIAEGLGLVRAGGGGREGAMRAVEALLAAGVDGLLSFGVAAGLDPALAPGALVVPARVRVAGQDLACDAGLLGWLGGATVAALADAGGLLATPAAKRDLRAATGAAAADLESGPLALTAARAGLPFAGRRAGCDPAARGLPEAAALALDAAGAIRPGRVIGRLLRHPGEIGGLLALGREAAAARATLRRARARLGERRS